VTELLHINQSSCVSYCLGLDTHAASVIASPVLEVSTQSQDSIFTLVLRVIAFDLGLGLDRTKTETANIKTESEIKTIMRKSKTVKVLS